MYENAVAETFVGKESWAKMDPSMQDVYKQRALKAVDVYLECVKGTYLICGDILMDTSIKKAYVLDVEVKLGPRLYELLKVFLLHQGTLLPNDTLLRSVWGNGSIENEQNLRVCVGELNKKIPRGYIANRPRYGYIFAAPVGGETA